MRWPLRRWPEPSGRGRERARYPPGACPRSEIAGHLNAASRLALALLLGASAAPAVEYFVAPAGSDTNAGTTVATPFRSIQRALDAAAPGDILTVRGGVYREYLCPRRTATPAGPITLRAYRNEAPLVTGADAVTNWTHHTGEVWKVTDWVPRSQQVFEDGVALRQVGWPNDYLRLYVPEHYPVFGTNAGDLVRGSFHCDATNRTLYVRLSAGDTPTQHVVEVATRPQWFHGYTQAWYRLEGLRFAACSSFGYSPGGWWAIRTGPHARLDRCRIEWSDCVGLHVEANSEVRRSEINNHGMIGLSFGTNVRVSACLVTNNNWKDFYREGAAGGMKLMTPDRQCSGTIEGSEIAWNRGHAVWFDSCTSVLERVVRGNFIHDNEGIGVFLELTRGAEVVNNLIVSNRAGGIFISGSERIRAWHNTLVGNVGLADIYVYGLPRVMGWEVGQPEWAVLVSNQILNNIVCSLCTNDIGIPPDNAATNEFTLGNRSDFNCFFRPDGRYRFAWGGVAGYTQWVDWSAATGWDSNSLAANPLLVWSNHAFPVPVTTSPVVDRAASILGVTTDGRGVPRPLDGNGDGQAAPDIGAVEAVHATADTDGDGLSDAAEQDVHRTSPVQEDTDGDRFRDGAEVAAGTCPTNAHSYLGMLQPVAEAGPSSLVVRWTSAVDRRYDLYQSTNLLLAFAPLVTNIEATPPTNEYPLAPAVPAGFYRVNLAP